MVKVLIKKDPRWSLEGKKIGQLAAKIVAEHGFGGKEVELSIMLVGKRKAKTLNQDYRKMDYIPQVLAFPLSLEKDEDGVVRIGDVVICWPLLQAEMIRENKSFWKVMEEWLRHGIGNLFK